MIDRKYTELSRKEKLQLIKMFVRGVLHNKVRSFTVTHELGPIGLTGRKIIKFSLDPSDERKRP